MKLKASKEALLKAISVVDGAVSSRATLPILSNILIETTGKNQIKITGTKNTKIILVKLANPKTIPIIKAKTLFWFRTFLCKR